MPSRKGEKLRGAPPRGWALLPECRPPRRSRHRSARLRGFGTALLPRDRSAALELSWRAARDSDPAARQQAAQVMSETGAESSHSTASLFAKQSQSRRSLRLPAAGDSDPAVRQRPAQAMSETGAGSSHSTAIAFCKTKPISARSLRPLAARDSDSAVRQRPAQAMSENGAGSSHSTASLFAKQSQSRREAISARRLVGAALLICGYSAALEQFPLHAQTKPSFLQNKAIRLLRIDNCAGPPSELARFSDVSATDIR